MFLGRPSVQEPVLSWYDRGHAAQLFKGGGVLLLGLVQVIVHGGEGTGADTRASHEGQTVSSLTNSLSQRGLLWQVMSLCNRYRHV